MARTKRQFSLGEGVKNVLGAIFRPIGAFLSHPLTVVLGMVGGFGGVFAGAMYMGYLSDLERAEIENFEAFKTEFARNARNAEFEGGTLSLLDENGVYLDTSLIDFSFDFANQAVAADGESEADRMFTFPEFEELNPGRIDEVRIAACAVAENLPNLMQAFADEHGEENPYRENMETRARNFVRDHCPS